MSAGWPNGYNISKNKQLQQRTTNHQPRTIIQNKPNTNPICRGVLSGVACLSSVALAKEEAKTEASGEAGSNPNKANFKGKKCSRLRIETQPFFIVSFWRKECRIGGTERQFRASYK